MLYVFVCPDVLLSAILIVRCVMSLLYSSGSLYSYVMPTPRPHLSMNYLYSLSLFHLTLPLCGWEGLLFPNKHI